MKHLPVQDYPRASWTVIADAASGLDPQPQRTVVRCQARIVERRARQLGRLTQRVRRCSSALADDVARLHEIAAIELVDHHAATGEK